MRPRLSDLGGAVAFVTGGASGIGLGICRALAARQARVAIADIRADHLAEARDLAEREGWADRAVFLPLDVVDRAHFADALAETERALGPLQILVNNAGVGVVGPVAGATHADWDWGVSVNLTGVTNGIVAGLPLIQRQGQGGHILNTASLGAVMSARPTRGLYAATKAAVVALTEHLRLELEGQGIGVSVLLPGPTTTNIEESGKVRHDRYRSGSPFEELEVTRLSAPSPPTLPWLDPLACGEMAVAGILADQLYIATHHHYLESVKRRHAAIEQAVADAGGRADG